MTDLGTLGGSSSSAYGVSADGSVVVGWAQNDEGHTRAFRWTASGSMTDLGTLGGCCGAAYGVSANGSVVVGWARDDENWYTKAVRWTDSEGVQEIDTPYAYEGSVAYDVSASGSAIVGISYFTSGIGSVFLWQNGTVQTIASYAEAVYGVSADGSVVVGSADYGAVRWVNGSMQDLGGGYGSTAYDVSADGSIVVGEFDTSVSGREHAFRWTQATGAEDLNTVYADLLSDGSYLIAARAISPDGRYIVGYGYNAATRRNEAFLLDTGFPLRGDVDRNGSVDDADLLEVLFSFGGQGYTNQDLNWDGTIDDADLLTVLFNFGSGG